MLKDTPCSMKVFDILRQMTVRQADRSRRSDDRAEQFHGHVRAFWPATAESQLAATTKKPEGKAAGRRPRPTDRPHGTGAGGAPDPGEVGRGNTYGIDNLHLTVARDTSPSPLRTIGWFVGWRPTSRTISASSRRSPRSTRSARKLRSRPPNGNGDPDPISAGTMGSRTVGRIKHGGNGGEPA